jgi:CBS domain-containing protein
MARSTRSPSPHRGSGPEAPRASQLMTKEVVTVRPEARLIDVARALREFHISGVPVVDAADHVVGVVSETDVYRTLRRSTGLGSIRGLLDLVLGSAPVRGPDLLEQSRERLRNARARDAMSSHVLSIGPSASVSEISQLMRRASVNRLPVIDDGGRLVGIVTRADVVDGLTGRTARRRGRLHPRLPRPSSRRARADPFADI